MGEIRNNRNKGTCNIRKLAVGIITGIREKEAELSEAVEEEKMIS